MENHRYGVPLTVLAAMLAGGFAAWLVAIQQGAVFGPVGWTYVAWISFSVYTVGAAMWLWLAFRPLWGKEKPRVDRALELVRPEHYRDQCEDSDGKWLYICVLRPRRPLPRGVRLRVTVSATPHVIRGHVYDRDHLASMLHPDADIPKVFDVCKRDAAVGDHVGKTRDLIFNARDLTTMDELKVIAESYNEELRITRIRVRLPEKKRAGVRQVRRWL